MIKLDIITGFLGAGKTTLCNLILKHYLSQNRRPVYIVNEFGKTGLDAEIIRSDGFSAVEIEGGCICCTLKDDVATTIKMVIEKYNPTNIIFEPSGIFIFDNFFDIVQSSDISSICEIGSVITVVDCLNYNTSKAIYGSFIYNQIKNSRILVLSKTSIASESVFETICDLKNINPEAIIVSKSWDDFSSNDYELILSPTTQFISKHNVHHHSHLKTVTINMKNSITKAKLDELSCFVKDKTFGDIYRGKGIAKLNGKLVLINIVGNNITLSAFKGLAESNFTFIGQNIDADKIKLHLQNLYI